MTERLRGFQGIWRSEKDFAWKNAFLYTQGHMAKQVNFDYLVTLKLGRTCEREEKRKTREKNQR